MATKKGNVIQFKKPVVTKGKGRVSKMTTKMRTTADAVREDAGLMAPISKEEYLGEISGFELDNRGSLAEMLERTAKRNTELGLIDPYMTDDE